MKVLAATLTGDTLVPTRVQPEGKGPMDAADFLRGARPEPGETFA